MHLRFRTLVSFLRAKRYMKWRILALVLVALVLASRLTIWFVLTQTNDSAARQNFDMTTVQRVDDIQNRFEVYANTLYAARALFLTGTNVSRQNWNAFVEAQQLTKRYPAFYALAYISAIHRADIGSLAAQLNDNRSPDETEPITIHPLITGNNLAVVTYVAPHTVNQSGIGTNVLADPTRANALAEARDSGLPHASKPLSFITDLVNAPPSILIVLPIYTSSADSLETVAQRQAALQGYVVLALRMQPLLDEVFALPDADNLDVSVTANSQIMYQHGPSLSGAAFDKQQDVTVAGQIWTVTFKAAPGFGLSTVAQIAPTVLSLSALPFLLTIGLILYFATRVYQPK